MFNFIKLILLMGTIFIPLTNLYANLPGKKTTLIATVQSWQVYTSQLGNQKECFMLAKPTEYGGNYTKRGQPYLIIRNVSKSIDEVSVTSGYKYKKFLSGELGIYKSGDIETAAKKLIISAKKGICTTGKTDNFIFDIIEDEHCWLRDPSSDVKIIQDFISGQFAVFTSVSTKDSCSCEIYSLKGFKKAYEQLKKSCANE